MPEIGWSEVAVCVLVILLMFAMAWIRALLEDRKRG
jgi:hypothetical protein